MAERASGLIDPGRTDLLHGGPSFTLGHRAFRACWNVAWLLLAAWTPPPLHGWRVLLLRLFGARIGRGVHVYGSARIWYPPNLEMGDHSVLGWKVNCYCQDLIVLEDYANVAQFSHLVAGSHDVDDPAFPLVTKPIRICRGAWIASGAFVGPGVVVGEGAVLGARGVAFSDLQAWTIYAGNPARPLRARRAKKDADE